MQIFRHARIIVSLRRGRREAVANRRRKGILRTKLSAPQGSKIRHFTRNGARLEPLPDISPGTRSRSWRIITTQIEKVGTMGLFSKDIHTMDDLFVHTLRDVYYAEKQLLKALPEMVEKASDDQLKQAFQSHLGETKNHVVRLEQVFKMHGVEAKGIDCPAIDGIIEEAEEVSGEVEDQAVLNAALAAAAQAAEHYEIARYGTLIAWAKQLGRNDCARVLQQNLDEEKAADRKLTEIAETRLNLRAAS
jgi:ferritin-like metal-binding protein YciE